MTRPSKREIEREVETLRESGDGDRPGFHRFKIGGEPEPERTGFYEYDAERGEYINEHGHTISADEHDSESGCSVTIVGDGEADQ